MLEYKGGDSQSIASKSTRQRRHHNFGKDSRRSSNRYGKADNEDRIPGTIGGIPDALKPGAEGKDKVKINIHQSVSPSIHSGKRSSK